MARIQTKVFKTNKTQAVRLPKAVAFKDSVSEVEIIVVGNSRVISPAGESWNQWFDTPGVSDDFMTERGQSADQDREIL